MLYTNWFVSLIVAVSIVHSTLSMSAIIVDDVPVAVVLSVWILVSFVLDSSCVVIEKFLLWKLDLVD